MKLNIFKPNYAKLLMGLGLITTFIVLVITQLPPWNLSDTERLNQLRAQRDKLGAEMLDLKRSMTIDEALEACQNNPLNSVIDCASADTVLEIKHDQGVSISVDYTPPQAANSALSEGEKLDPELLALMVAIAKHEGWDNPKNLVRRYLNPGAMMAVEWCDYEKTGHHRFMIFKTEEDGWNCLEKALIRYRDKGATISSLIHRWAPSSDRNNPGRYASIVARQLGVPVSTKLSDLY